MIILLGGSGYVGQAFQRSADSPGCSLPQPRRGRNSTTARRTVWPTFLAESKATFVINAAGYTGKPNVDACELHKAACLFGNAVLPGRIREACERTGTPWGHISSGCIFSGERPGGGWLPRGGHAELLLPHEPLQLLQRHQGAGRGSARWTRPTCYVWRLRIPFSEVESPRNYLTKVMRYARLLDGVQLSSEPARRVRAGVLSRPGRNGCPSVRTT